MEEETDAIQDAEASVPEEVFPTAVVGRARGSWLDILRASKLWWLTLLCVLLAAGLAWFSLPEKGTQIEIQFPQGHGLKPEDEVRHRGISVGVVESVDLNSELSGIAVRVSLRPGAELLACEGSRFWIVRPEFSLSGISGLDTAVGSKYIAVDPGDAGSQRRLHFTGLAAEPADAALDGEGVEVVLRGDETHSITSGSPVTWRGVEVGRVTSIGLSPDARYADIHARIRSPYTKLLRGNSKFWATSGVDLDFSLQGVTMNAESLETIARGGVSFITLNESASADQVAAGHVFKLHAQADEKWKQDVESVRMMETELPPTALVTARWRVNGLALTRRREKSCNAIAVQTTSSSASRRLILPADLTVAPDNAEQGSFGIVAEFPGRKQNGQSAAELPIELAGTSGASGATQSPIAVARLSGDAADIATVSISDFRVSEHPEDCWIVKSANSNDGVVTVHQAIGRHELTLRNAAWQLDSLEIESHKWHGAPVVSLEDGRIIGVLIATRSRQFIQPVDQALLDLVVDGGDE